MTSPALDALTPVAHCAYCDGPLPADPLLGHPRDDGTRAGYCCYGCRLLGESGRKTLADLPVPETTWFQIGVGAVIAGQAMLLGLAVNLSSPRGATRWLLHGALILSALAVFALLGIPLARAALASLRQKRITIELLFLAGVVGAFGASLNSTISGVGAIYYEVVAILLTVYTVGKTLGAQSRARAFAEARKLCDVFDTCRTVRGDGSVVTVRAAQIRAGDQIQVLAGEPIPIDGRIVRGEAFVRETPLTGEPFPVVRRPGDAVFAGSFSEDGELVIAATVSGDRRRFDGLLAMVNLAREAPSALQSQADRIVRWFLPLVVAVALGTFVFWGARRGLAVGLFNAMAVLLVACPCAMGLATPLALWNGLATLAARGLVGRSGDLIERLARLTHVVFDKTGTLTVERLSLIDFACVGGGEERSELLQMLRAVQSRQPHPVARAFVTQAGEPAVSGTAVKSVRSLPARGIEAWVESPRGREFHLRVGERDLATDVSVEPDLLRSLRQSAGDHLVYVSVDGRLEGIAAVRERLRDSTREALLAVERLGARVLVMTGDQQARAESLGLGPVRGGLTPMEKAQAVEDLRAAGGEVGVVGDGVNDAAALRVASVGIALEHGAGITTANADAVLYGSDLRVIPWAMGLCRQVRASIRSNLRFAAVYNLVGIVLAASGVLHPVVAALLMVVSSAVVSWRALRGTEAAETCCGADDPRDGLRRRSVTGLGVQGVIAAPRCRRTPKAGGTAGPEPAARPAGSGKVWGLLVALQGPFIAWLGQLPPAAAGWAVVVCVVAGAAIGRFRTGSPEGRRYANMVFAMLGLGNWGMLLGWWVEAGFAPVVQQGICMGCGASDYFGPGGIRIPWMYVGMLLFGLPPMVWGGWVRSSGWGRLWLALLSGAGMAFGMAYGARAALAWAGTKVAGPFLSLLFGMILGMLLGMVLGCEAGRAVGRWRRQGH